MKNPKTPAEWQEAVNSAHVMRSIADCMMYGLITGPDVNVARCDELLEQGAHLGIRPEPEEQVTFTHIGRSWFFGFYLSPTSFRLRLILKRCGFDVFYLALNPYVRRFESGYRIYKGGIRDHLEGCDYPLLEEFVVKSPLETFRGGN